MQIQINHSPAFASARCLLGQGETINAESGSMYQQSLGMQVSSQMQGGLFGALKRSLLSGESFFVSSFHAPGGGWVDLAPSYPGDVLSLNVSPEQVWVLTRGSWLGSDKTVDLDTKFGGAKMYLGGEGFFTVRCSGIGQVIASAYGATERHVLREGEGLTVDTGHIVAYSENVRTSIRKVSKSIMSSLKSGEGLVMDFHGPGEVITQTRDPLGFAAYISGLIPSNN